MRTHCDRPSSGHGPWCITRPGSSRGCTLLVAGLLAVSGSDAAAQGTRLLRQPNASATHVVVSSERPLGRAALRWGGAPPDESPGGRVEPTLLAGRPVIAFTGEYGGNPDVYVVSTEGGEPRRLTWHPHSDVVRGGRRTVRASSLPPSVARPRCRTRASGPCPWPVGDAGGAAYPTRPQGGVLCRCTTRCVPARGAVGRGVAQLPGGPAQPIRLIDLASSDEEKVPWAGSHDPTRSG